MSSLLYVSYSSKLTKEEKLSIDRSVLQNRLAVRKFPKKVCVKGKVVVITTTLGILVLFFGIENVDEIRLSKLHQAPIMKVEHPENSLDELFKVRGEDLTPLAKVLFKIVLIWTLGKKYPNRRLFA
jgi:hypothetical protein